MSGMRGMPGVGGRFSLTKRSTSVAWTPKSVPGLQLWLKSDAGLYQDAAKTTPASADTNPVGAWADQSGLGRDALQSTNDGFRPILKLNQLNGRPTVRFQGTDDRLVTAAFSGALTQPTMIFTVIKVTGAANDHIFFDGIAAGNRNSAWINSTENAAKLYAGTSVVVTQTQAEGSFLIVTSLFSGASSTNYINGIDGALVNPGAHTLTGLTIGVNSAQSGGFLTGDVAEILIYNPSLSAANRQLVENYLSSRYGIAIRRAIAARATNYLTTPTYDSSGKTTHPDVYDAGAGQTWNGYRYWMANTPWPNENSAFEKPSILASADGTTWVTPVGLTNPVEPGQATGLDPDPDIIVDQAGTMWLHWIWEDAGTTTSKIYRRSSTDGVTWSDREEVLSDVQLTYLSPAAIWDGTQYVLYYNNATTNPAKIYRRTCATINGVWSVAVECTFPMPTGRACWHLDVAKLGAAYWALVTVTAAGTMGGANNEERLYKSADGVTWTDYGSIFRDGSGAWDNHVYRASIVPQSANSLDLWYSGVDGSKNWHIGRTTINVTG